VVCELPPSESEVSGYPEKKFSGSLPDGPGLASLQKGWKFSLEKSWSLCHWPKGGTSRRRSERNRDKRDEITPSEEPWQEGWDHCMEVSEMVTSSTAASSAVPHHGLIASAETEGSMEEDE
jgi:hypothetical protein